MADDPLFSKYGKIFDSGKLIFEENEEGLCMYIIQEGSVRIMKTFDNREYTLAVLGKGDFFGEMAIVSKIRRTATAVAADTVKVLEFDRQGFIGMIEKNAKIALNIIDKLSRRLLQANQQILHLKKKDELGLVALNLHFAFLEAGIFMGHLDPTKTTRELSINLEIPMEKIMDYFKQFTADGIIRMQENKIVLMDTAKLIALAEGGK
ncbi:MAG: Crp/Fnr family transcriptional regulator [Spirochaetales bacterium]|nr:MAG: Crp/Fnr family transcriptional regulator [Spirochaetales bacterium]